MYKDTIGLNPPSPGPAKGVNYSDASQSKREAAFYAVAKTWGLSEYLPECHLLLLDGEEYAAVHFLPSSYENMAQLAARDPGAPRRILSMYRPDGLLHKWAVLDLVLGQTDRHAGNILVGPGGVCQLIDEGSSLAGASFAPNSDPNSFIPYYLRAFAPDDFNTMDPEHKLHALPRLNEERAKELGAWILALSGEDMAKVLVTYGVDPSPSLARLNALKQSLSGMLADLAVLAAWVLR